MRTFGRRKIPTLIKYGLFLTAVVLLMTLLLIRGSSNSALSKVFEPKDDLGGSAKSEHQSTPSICLGRDTLDSAGVKLFSNRSSNKQYYLTIGIPTIARSNGNEYLVKTLHSLTANPSTGNTPTDLLIVLQLGDKDEHKRRQLASEMKKKYSHLIDDEVLDIIQVYRAYYPSLDRLKQRFGDNTMRVKWRSKQVIDFSFLFCYCYGLGKYHLQLEDDVIASPHYYLKLQDFIKMYESKEKWFTLDASVLGYIGKVYHNYDLNEIATFYYIFFDEMPVDWLEYQWRSIKGQQGRWRFRTASLFEHIGLVSSLKSKNQVAKEPYFDNQTQKFLGLNPPARIQTDLIAEQNSEIKSAYAKGDGYFWGRCYGKSKCFIRVVFKDSIPLQRIVIETGGNFALNDTIHSGSLELGTYLNTNDCVHYESVSAAHFKKGTLDVMFVEKKPVNCFKVMMQRQNEWVFIREINVWRA